MGVEKYKDGRIFYVKYYKDQCLRMEYNVSEKAVKTVVGQDLDYKFEKHKTLEALSLRQSDYKFEKTKTLDSVNVVHESDNKTVSDKKMPVMYRFI